jgi:excisionase family DNA binding protein
LFEIYIIMALNKKEVLIVLNIIVDENELMKLYREEIRKRLDKIEDQTLFIDVKELCKMLSLSRPTVEKLFLYNPDFPKIRVGKKWLFNRKEVEAYIKQWSINIRKAGGSIEIEQNET